MLTMRGALIEPGTGLFTEIMSSVDAADEADQAPLRQGSDLRMVAYVAAATAAAATAATAAGAIVLASRSKRPAS